MKIVKHINTNLSGAYAYECLKVRGGVRRMEKEVFWGVEKEELVSGIFFGGVGCTVISQKP